jgi:hypothetical protein
MEVSQKTSPIFPFIHAWTKLGVCCLEGLVTKIVGDNISDYG